MKHYTRLLIRLLLATTIAALNPIVLFAQDTVKAPDPGKFGPMGDKYDQNKLEYKLVKTEIEQLLHLNDQLKLTNLLPFSIGDKTGIIDKSTMKVITAPTTRIKEIVTIANPNLWGVYRNDTASYIFTIYQKDGKILITKMEEEGNPPDKVDLDPAPIKDLADGQLGYTLNNKGVLIAQSKKYRSVKPAFSKDGKIYAAVQLKENSLFGIVDTKGEIFPGFEFKYRNLIHNKATNYYQNNIWFYAEDADRNKYFVGINGTKKTVPGLSEQPFREYDPFGYNIQHNTKNKTWGLFDQSTMDWVITPQSQFEILFIHYTSNNRPALHDVDSRKDCEIYIYVKEKKLHYYIDLNGVKYLPPEYFKTKVKGK